MWALYYNYMLMHIIWESEGHYYLSIMVIMLCKLQLKYGQLLTCIKAQDGKNYIILKPLTKLELFGVAIENEVDCPLLEMEERVEIIPSSAIIEAISVVHQSTSTCYYKTNSKITVEREEINTSYWCLCHDKRNKIYCLNIYKI